MKKTVSLILALVLMCTTLFSLTACGGSDASFDEFNAQIAELTNQINEANSKISALAAEKAAQAAEITNLKANIEVLEQEKATLAQNKATLAAEKTLLEERIAELEAEIAKLRVLMDGNSNQLLEEIAELEEQIDSIEAEVATLNSVKTNLESEISSLNSQISNLNAEKAALTARVSELEASVAAKNTEIANLNSTVSALTIEKNTLIVEKNALVTENNELKEENEELKALVEALRNCLKGIHTYENGACTTCGENKVDVAYVRCDKDGTPNANGEYLLFGEYPQTIKADDVTITDTTDDRGYYLGSDGSYYAKVTATPFASNYTFSTGTTVTSGSVYYFKVEPIRWRILSEKDGEAFILCDSVIANIAYQPDYYQSGSYYYTTANGAPEGTYANNYKYSNVRNWLNSTFYETAFSSLECALILTTEVDNSAKSTNPYGNETFINNGVNDYACENTSDKIFLISTEEASNSNYDFEIYYSSNASRRILSSDYSRATGAYMLTLGGEGYYGNGWWLLRSPDYIHSRCERAVHSEGYTADSCCQYVYNSYGGIAPALRITL